jgi:hypothetical protein
MLDLSNEEEVKKFDEALNIHGASIGGFIPKHIILREAFGWLNNFYPESASRIFTAVVDIQINFVYLCIDNGVSGGYSNVVNHEFALRSNSNEVLHLDETIDSLLKIHHADSAFCLRYRAIWDKLMGLCFLLYCPEKYEAYIGAKSKIGFFTKHLAEHPQVKKLINNYLIVGSLEDFLRKFEDNFRTPEIHGTGRLRKYAFNVDPEQRMVLSTNYWNALNEVVMKVGILFKNPPNSQ